MSRPTVSTFTERAYGALPAVYRDNDSDLDYPLLRWISLLGDQAGEIRDLYERIDYVTPADGGDGSLSELTDPDTADASWLPWLAQLVGVQLDGLSGTAARDAIRAAVSGFQSGTKTAIAAAARSALTGTKTVTVYDHSISSPGNGGAFDVMIVTRGSETPDPAAVLAAVVAKNAKPAGVVLHHTTFSASWDAVEAAHPTWADIDGHTFTELEETGL